MVRLKKKDGARVQCETHRSECWVGNGESRTVSHLAMTYSGSEGWFLLFLFVGGGGEQK